MRAHEFLTEDDDGQKIPTSHQKAVPDMKSHPALDNSSPYAPWRFAALYLAGAGHASGEYEHDPTVHGPVGQKLTTVAYSDGDERIIRQAEKKFGAGGRSKSVTSRGSKEQDDTHKISPVNGFKGY